MNPFATGILAKTNEIKANLMTLKLPALLMALFTLIPQVQADNALTSATFVRRVEYFNKLFPQEKVYLHFDNTGYFQGETIWFKAYVTRTDNAMPSDLSKVLYVELLNPQGEVVKTCKAHIDKGQADGYLQLNELYTSGFFEVRAYTRYMLNWDSRGIFSRVFPIFKAPATEGDYSRKAIDERGYTYRLPDYRSDTADSLRNSAKKTDTTKSDRIQGLNMRFYPEGGHLVEGLTSRVAFDVYDRQGIPVDTTGFLAISSGKKIPLRTLREGRGVFSYTPSAVPAHVEMTDQHGQTFRFTLPEAEKTGCVITVDTNSGDDINVYLRHTADYGKQVTALLVNGGNVDAAALIDDQSGLKFHRSDLNEGVNQLTFIDDAGHILAERMFFVYPRTTADSIAITADQPTIRPCGRISLTAKTRPHSTFSVAVRDYASETNGCQQNMATWLLLSSDLKGYIHNPEYYLESDDATHRRDVDLLMMVQGWHRYDLNVMSGQQPFYKRHPIEDHLYLFGRLRQAKKKYPVNDVRLNTTLYNRGGNVLRGETMTDSAGYYAFSIPDCEGEWTMLLNTMKDDREAKYYVGIDRDFSPQSRTLSPLESKTVPLSKPLLKLTPIEAFDKHIPMDQRNHLIKEVKVKGRRIYENARARWENEKNGAYWASIRYDCDKEADRLADQGKDDPGFYEWLVRRNPFFLGDNEHLDAEASVNQDNETAEAAREADNQRDSGTEGKIEDVSKDIQTLFRDGITYKNRPIVWILNNQYKMVTHCPLKSVKTEANIDNMPIWLYEAKAVYISEDASAWKQYLLTDEPLDSYHPVTIFVYTHHTFPTKQKGLRRSTYEGYATAKTFEMPDYSVLPPMADHRRTLYWNPNVKTDDKGEAKVNFYNNSTCRQIVISAEGLSQDGCALTY